MPMHCLYAPPMLETLPFSRHLARRGASGDRSGAARRLLALALPGPLAAAALLLTPALASADTSSTLTVVGTSDLSDSGLIANVIQPQFNKAFPQFTFKYVGAATGAAIQSAQNGTGGPSALIVHAASLENQFVANGFSYNDQYGNAIFINDFVLAGPTGDPAGVAANGANNIAQAFADVAAAGDASKATFFTRGGTTTASGTTVEEHQIWALVHSSGLEPASLSLCVVSAADGGGMSPVKSSALNGQPCPDSGTVQSPDNPSWYFINAGSNQAANVIAANSCPPANAPSGPGTCYVLTDRGTFDYLGSGADPAGTIPNLKIVTRGPQSASAPSGVNALVNYFHVYIINPHKPGETVNLTAAQDFVTFLTTQAFQSQLKSYLASTSDPGGAPFVASASPNLTASGIPRNYHAGRPVRVSGTVTNAQPGFPAPAGATVTVQEIKGALLIPIATGKTNSSGQYKIKFVPPTTGSYQVSTGSISQIEIPTLTPPYGDILSPAATTPVKVTVHAATANLRATSQGGTALLIGSVAPGTGHVKGTVTVFARAVGKKGAFHKVARERLAATQGNFALSIPLAAGAWQLKVKFEDPKQVVGASSRTVTVTVGAMPSTGVSLRSLKATKGAVTVGGAVAPAGVSGAKVELVGLNTTPGAPARFKVLATKKLGAGKASVSLHAKLKSKTRWVLQLVYLQPGQAPSFSGLRTANLR
jgi:tungstate transport system substrate-binding protein